MTLHRKLLITSFLREAPYDDVLHEACPDYVPVAAAACCCSVVAVSSIVCASHSC
jgi:hypothetical protein